MFHPVGSQPPTVYWRRRLLVLGSTVIVVVLLAITVSAFVSGGSRTPAGGGGPSTTPVADGTTPSTSGHPTSTAPSHHPHRSSSASHSASPSTSGSTVAATCRSSDLSVAAVAGHSSYHVGAKPTVELQVTDVGSAPCVQDLADKQIVLRVYNGVSRVWGSHDCEIQPGSDKRTLAVGAPVRVSISWSGETSEPGCKGTRQQVGAGTYTLYASLSGKTGKAAQFTIN